MELYIEALRGLRYLHSNGFVHGDLKPTNIGINWKAAIILDVGSMIEVQPKGFIKSDPGCRGTIGFLAPEYEMGRYNEAVDVWSMGIILFMLTEGHHPWPLSKNPWRLENSHNQPQFHESYERSLRRLENDGTPKLLQGEALEFYTGIY